MAKGDSLKRYKNEQKVQTRKRIEEAIETLKSTQGDKKITVSQVASLSGITRASIYANYQDLLERFKSSTDKNSFNLQNNVKDKNEVVSKLREENKDLREANQKLMDQVVTLKNYSISNKCVNYIKNRKKDCISRKYNVIDSFYFR